MTRYIPELPLPPGIDNTAEFGDRIGWGTGDEAARKRADEITREEIESMGLTLQMATTWLRFYEEVLARNPKNPSVRGRIDLMSRIIKLLK